MSRIHALAVAAALLAAEAPAVIPLPSSPSWTSSDNDYSTGGAFAFIDTNRFIDLCTSNGNDMTQNRNGIYLNNNGTLETVASWRSADQGYFGHCYVGDVNNDGLADMAVAYLGNGTSGDHLARIYRNAGNGLGTSPAWKAKDRHSSFDCCLGDFDLDGDLDLAISAGDAYSPIEYDRARIYRNNGGTFDSLPCWSARDTNPSDAARFCDIDNDGDLDLFVGQVVPGSGRGKVTMYRNQSGILDTVPSWTARAGVGWVLRLAFGDYDNDGRLDLAVASNNQQGEPNSIKVFHNSGVLLDTAASFTMLRNRRYSSCVAWADVNGDGYADLAAGGWWEPAVVFENRAGVLDTTPTWSWYPSPGGLVCETVVWADVTNSHLTEITQAFSGNGQRKLFTLGHRPVQSLDSIVVDNARLPYSAYCCDPLVGWFSLAAAPAPGTDNVKVFYRHSAHPDLAVTNWEPSYPNYLFRNTTPTGISSEPRTPYPGPRTPPLSAWPNPFTTQTTLRFSASAPFPIPDSRFPVLHICDAAGRRVRALTVPHSPCPIPHALTWDGRDEAGARVRPGVYLCTEQATGARLKLVRLAD